MAAVQMPSATTFWTRKHDTYALSGACTDKKWHVSKGCSHASCRGGAGDQALGCLSSGSSYTAANCAIHSPRSILQRHGSATLSLHLSRRSFSSTGASDDDSGGGGASQQQFSATAASAASVDDDTDEYIEEDDDEEYDDGNGEEVMFAADENMTHIELSPDDGMPCACLFSHLTSYWIMCPCRPLSQGVVDLFLHVHLVAS
jgi:hypothetical protein